MTTTPFAADLATQRRHDLRQEADAWRRQQSVRRHHNRTRPRFAPLQIAPRVLSALRRMYSRGQLGPVCNYVVRADRITP